MLKRNKENIKYAFYNNHYEQKKNVLLSPLLYDNKT
jgi:hypothetical protein